MDDALPRLKVVAILNFFAATVVRMPEQQGPSRAVAIAPDGKHLAVVIGAHIVLVCDGRGRELRRFEAAERKTLPAQRRFGIAMRHEEEYARVATLAFSPDGKWI